MTLWSHEVAKLFSVHFSCSVMTDSLWPHELQHARPPCPWPTPGVHSDSRPSSQWCHNVTLQFTLHICIISFLLSHLLFPENLVLFVCVYYALSLLWAEAATYVTLLCKLDIFISDLPSTQVKVKVLVAHSCLFATPWTVAHKALLSMGSSRQKYWSGLPCPPPRDLPNTGIKPVSPASPSLQADSLPLSHWGSPQMTWTE